VRFQVLTAASMKFRFVFWDVLPCKIIVDRRFRERSSPWWWRQYVPLKCRSTIILHGSTSQKTNLNFIVLWLIFTHIRLSPSLTEINCFSFRPYVLHDLPILFSLRWTEHITKFLIILFSPLSSYTWFLAYFQKIKVGLSTHQSVCLCVCVPH
jgi:hypothetical protein